MSLPCWPCIPMCAVLVHLGCVRSLNRPPVPFGLPVWKDGRCIDLVLSTARIHNVLLPQRAYILAWIGSIIYITLRGTFFTGFCAIVSLMRLTVVH